MIDYLVKVHSTFSICTCNIRQIFNIRGKPEHREDCGVFQLHMLQSLALEKRPCYSKIYANKKCKLNALNYVDVSFDYYLYISTGSNYFIDYVQMIMFTMNNSHNKHANIKSVNYFKAIEVCKQCSHPSPSIPFLKA